MELVDRVVALFGLSPEDPTVSSLLDDYKISERPVFDETPIHWISAKDKGFVLMFEEKLGYKDIYGPCAGSGGMVLGGIRVYGSQNDDDFAPFKQKLPCGLDFSQSLDEILHVLGKADLEEEPGTPKRVVQWDNVKGLQVGGVLDSAEKHMSYWDIQPVRAQFRR